MLLVHQSVPRALVTHKLEQSNYVKGVLGVGVAHVRWLVCSNRKSVLAGRQCQCHRQFDATRTLKADLYRTRESGE